MRDVEVGGVLCHMHAKKLCRKCCYVLNPIWSSLQSSYVTYLDAGCSSACAVISCIQGGIVWCGVYCFDMVSTALHAASSKVKMHVLLDGHDHAMLSFSIASCLCSSHVINGHVSLPAVGRAQQKASGRGWGHARFGPAVACQQECPQVTSFPRGDCVTGLLLVLPAVAIRSFLLWPQLKDALFWLLFVCAQQLHIDGVLDSNQADDNAPLS